VNVLVISRDLLLASRILDLARRNGHQAQLADGPEAIDDVARFDLAFVNWADRSDGWGAQLASWKRHDPARPRLIVFGPHGDLEAHAAARAAGVGPMLARSNLVQRLPALLAAENPLSVADWQR
jgi:GNAT superfamily N-acetyltransferase